jgi:hypothetical protein
MCFSERVSWATFLVNGLGVARALSRNPDDPQKRTLAYTLGFIGSMQGFEALLWRDPTNHAIAAAAMLVNHAQPLVFWGLSKRFLNPTSPEKARYASALTGLYTAVVGMYTSSQFQKTLVKQTPCGLLWEWNYAELAPLVYALYISSCVATLHAYYDDAPRLISIFVATFGASVAVYRQTNMIGSMWCFIAAFLPWLV